MIAEVSGALSAFKVMKDIGESIIAAHDASTIQGKVRELNAVIIDAQTSMISINNSRSALIDRVRELEQQIMSIKAWEAEKQRYQLAYVEDKPIFAYALKKEFMSVSEPPHYLCQTCYENSKKRILQPEERSAPRARVYVCHDCGSELLVEGALPQSQKRSQR